MSGEIRLPPIVRTRSECGLRVIVAERPGVPLVAVRLVLQGGASLDPKGRYGLAHLVATVGRRGTRRRTGTRMDELVESMGAELGVGVDEDASYMGLSTPVEHLARALDVLADVAGAPTFPAAELGRLRRRELASLQHDLDEPGVVADRALLGAAYDGHPYGHPPEGRARDIAAIKRADLVGFHQRHYGTSSAIVVVVGPVKTAEVMEIVEARFGGWSRRAPELPELAEPVFPGRSVLVVDKPDLTQAQLRIASPGFARSNPDYLSGLVASAILGGAFTSRLMEAIRVNRGLSYGVRSRFASSRVGGMFFISSFTKIETSGELVQVALDETRRFCEGGPTPEELERTQNYLCGLHPLSLETHDQLAERLADLELHGLPQDEIATFRPRIREVTVEGCTAVARRHFPLDHGFIVAVGPARKLAVQLERFGPLTVVPAKRIL
ncbi:MAG: pitrilysin family protein [Anaeromyxobacteraceae bacterium]